ncbi:retention module-containing protein [Achromobacter pestifer]|uniref:Retention module-containing protein n=1 Tax=Achromobacter pestifer TaxID=1353889 RepID=A0A7D4DUI4_9BURK|nr:retention module-containing protein [Achromobacter pestifer]QKH33735.1 retention module-containing protein [Achromobacter pestifer]
MANTSPAIVNEISGRAWLRHGDGSLTELHQGSKIPVGSDVVTASGSTVSLQIENGMPIIIGESREVALTAEMTGTLDDSSEAAVAPPMGTDSERLLAVLRDGHDLSDELDPTAAAMAGGGGAGGSSFVRLARLLETTNPLDLSYSNPNRGDDDLPRMSSTGSVSDDEEAPTPLSVNNAPGARDDAGHGDQNSLVRGNLLANDADPDGDPLAITSVGGRAMTSDGVTVAGSNGGTFTVLPDGSYVFTPGNAFERLAAGETAVSTISYTIMDPSGATSTATAVVTITGTNDGPVSIAISDTSSLDAQTHVSYDISGRFSDPDASDKLIYTATGLPPGLSIDPHTGIITGDIDPSASQGGSLGVYNITITATDPSGATTSQKFDWAIANPAPIAVGDSGAASDDSALDVSAQDGVLANDRDPDGDGLTVSQVNGNAANVGAAIAGSHGGTFTLNADGSYSFDPGSAFQYLGAGEKIYSSITYTVSDGEGGTSTATLTVEITGTNQTPVILPHADQVLEDHSASGNVLSGAADADNDALSVVTYTVDGAKYLAGNTAYIAGVGSILINADGSYTFTPDADWNGAVPQVTYTVTDGSVTTSSTLDIGVLSVNEAPLSRDNPDNAVAGDRYVFGLNDFPFSDPQEGHSLKSVIIDSLPSLGTLLLNGEAIAPGREISLEDLANGKLTFQPDGQNFRRSDGSSFEFRVKDTGGTANGGQDTSHQQTFKLSTGELIAGNNYFGDNSTPDNNIYYWMGGNGNDVILGDKGGVLGIPPPEPHSLSGLFLPDPSELEVHAKSSLDHVLAPLSNDELFGRGGSDILFGDAINTDFLPWGVDGNPARPEGLLDGSGLWALKEFLLLKNGVPPTDADLYRFISNNHDMLDVHGDTRGGQDFLAGNEGDDILYGQGGNDELSGGRGQDILSGGTGNDILEGNGGSDVLIGGMGNDIVIGDGFDFYRRDGSGYSVDSDTFKWEFNDQGTITAPAVDTIRDFSILKPVEDGDILDLQELLVGESDSTLTKYLDFRKEGYNTVIDVNTQGKLGTQGADQKIVLENVDLTHDAYGQFMNNQAIINDLLQKGKLNVDHS